MPSSAPNLACAVEVKRAGTGAARRAAAARTQTRPLRRRAERQSLQIARPPLGLRPHADAHPIPRRRWGIGVLLGSGILVSFLDRINLSVAGPQLQKELRLGPAELGFLFSAYCWTYTVLQIPVGLRGRPPRRDPGRALGVAALDARLGHHRGRRRLLGDRRGADPPRHRGGPLVPGGLEGDRPLVSEDRAGPGHRDLRRAPPSSRT